jgi:hypothetical protein
VKKTLYIIRGIPGSGKSTLAEILAPDPDHRAEADHYMGPVFDRNRLGECHSRCRTKVQQALDRGLDPVVVSNTSLRTRDINLYSEMALEAGYTPFVIHCENEFGSIHQVPEPTMDLFRLYRDRPKIFYAAPPAPGLYLGLARDGAWIESYWDGQNWRGEAPRSWMHHPSPRTGPGYCGS